MNNPQNMSILPNTNDFAETFPMYAFEIIADIILAILLGVAVNQLSDWFGKKFNLPKYGKLLIQLFLIILVFYIMKIDSRYLYESWKGQTNYGIIFTSVFLAVQKNAVSFIEDIYIEED